MFYEKTNGGVERWKRKEVKGKRKNKGEDRHSPKHEWAFIPKVPFWEGVDKQRISICCHCGGYVDERSPRRKERNETRK